MPAAPPSRLRLQGEIHHVALRGYSGRALFRAPADREALERITGEFLTEFGARAHAFCWMTIHLHLVVEIPTARVAGRGIRSVIHHNESFGQILRRKGG